jgi:tetratricopeptide (TPR) repeat protein
MSGLSVANESLKTQSVEDLLNQGVVEYDDAKFLDAVSSFELTLERLPEAALTSSRGKILFNLGNAHYKSENYSGALSAYLAARVLLPRDADIQANITELKKVVRDDVNLSLPLNLYGKVLPFLEVFTISEIHLILGFLLLLTAVFGLLVKNIELRKLGILGLTFSVLLIPLVYTVVVLKKNNDIAYAVSSSDNLKIMSSPGKAGIELFEVSKSTPLVIKSDVGPYFKVEVGAVEQGVKKGWVKKSSVYAYF